MNLRLLVNVFNRPSVFKKLLYCSVSGVTESTKMADSLAESHTPENNKRQLVSESECEPAKKLYAGIDKAPIKKKRKVAMLLGYSGTGYYGMQRNFGKETVEGNLISALLKADMITQDESERVQSFQFQRAARTDKNVSAVRQVVSLKLPDGCWNHIDEINKHLPEQIRVFGIKRVTQGFNCKESCDARTYSYTMPTFAFSPEHIQDYQDFRITPELKEKLNGIFTEFLGTKNYHNFTCRKLYKDPSAKRYIISFECGDTFVNEMEFIVLKVKGQSFMMHQIRKMVGYTIAVLRGLLDVENRHKVWEHEKFDMPMAPGLGLVLEEVHYSRYNKKFGEDGIHENLTWSDCNDAVEAFKEKFILPTIVNTEINEKSMYNWLDVLYQHNDDENNGECLAQKTEEDEEGEEEETGENLTLPTSKEKSVASTPEDLTKNKKVAEEIPDLDCKVLPQDEANVENVKKTENTTENCKASKV